MHLIYGEKKFPNKEIKLTELVTWMGDCIKQNQSHRANRLNRKNAPSTATWRCSHSKPGTKVPTGNKSIKLI